MIPKGTTKFIKSLQLKKYRKREQCFLVEGEKSVAELLQSAYEVVLLACTRAFLDRHQNLPGLPSQVMVTTEKYLVQSGTLRSNQHALAVARMKTNVPWPDISKEWTVVLDNLGDPGNLGTIIRTCDWYGIRNIIASETTADVYAPKVIHATMGAFCRVAVHYTALEEYLKGSPLKVYGACLEGDSVHTTRFAPAGLLLIGSEAQGISDPLQRFISKKVTIPRYGRAESLNAAIATAVILDNIRRSGHTMQ